MKLLKEKKKGVVGTVVLFREQTRLNEVAPIQLKGILALIK